MNAIKTMPTNQDANPDVRQDLSAYINWVLYAVFGLLSDADRVAIVYGPGIGRAARVLQRIAADRGWRPAPRLFRGMLLNPALVDAGVIRRMEELSFVSYSDDPRVARWFADPTSRMNAPMAEAHPEARGYLTSVETDPSRILFHHEWRRILPLMACAVDHPMINERELEWHLDHQREVILTNVGQQEVTPYVREPGDEDLDALLTPPWIVD